MTPAEKAAHLERIANLFNNNAPRNQELFLAAAAHFRALVPDANGLLPCPMCGAGGRAIICGLPGDYRAVCGQCLLGTSPYMTLPDAIAAWNRRGGVAYE